MGEMKKRNDVEPQDVRALAELPGKPLVWSCQRPVLKLKLRIRYGNLLLKLCVRGMFLMVRIVLLCLNIIYNVPCFQLDCICLFM